MNSFLFGRFLSIKTLSIALQADILDLPLIIIAIAILGSASE